MNRNISPERGSANIWSSMAVMGRVAMLALLVLLGLQSAMATTYTVGGSGGWGLESSNSVYDSQFAKINLVVGDKLSFPYTAPQHNVYEISPSDLASCNFANPIAMYTTSNPVITLTSAGVHAFACEIPTHCSQFGMQLQVTVGAGAPVAAPASPPTPAAVTPAPAVAPVTAPTPAPVKAPAPSPIKAAPAPAPKAPVPAPKPSPPKAPIVAAPIEAPAPAPAGSGASFVSSGPALALGALFAGFAVLLL